MCSFSSVSQRFEQENLSLSMKTSEKMWQAMKNKPTSERVYRELTAEEQCRLADARAETRTLRDDILAEGRLRKRALKLAVDTENLGMFLIRFCSSKLTKIYLRLIRLIGGSG